MRVSLFTAIAAIALQTPLAHGAPAHKGYSAKYAVKKGDTLSTILVEKGVLPPLRLYGKGNWVERNLRANPKVRDWNHLRPGRMLTLVLPKKLPAKRKIAAVEKSRPKSVKKAEIKSGPSEPSNWDIRFALGVSRGTYSEAAAIDQTNTDGLFAFPEASFSADFWRGARFGEAAWQIGFDAKIAHLNKLNDVSFPIAWSGDVRFARRNMARLGDESWFAPVFSVGGESFSQGTPDRTRTATPVILTSRTTTMAKAGLGMQLTTTLFQQPLEISLLGHYVPTGTTKVSSGTTSETVHGFGGDLKFVLWLNQSLFSNVGVAGNRLRGGGLKLSGTSATADLGWQF